MSTAFLDRIQNELQDIDAAGLTKHERIITSAQSGHIVTNATKMLNLCANNYLGLADHPSLISAAAEAMQSKGLGMASVRFICGTQDLHRQLEQRLAQFLGKDDAILYAACFDANGGLFEPLLSAEDAIISDSLNHASIIDGIRLCKAQRYRYQNNNMDNLHEQLQQARSKNARHIMIATDGVFSMDGYLANLPEIVRLARQYDALVMVDDCHATGFMGKQGRGTPEHFAVDVDIITGTLGKALGGSIGGYVAAAQPIIDLLRQRSRPYLFSNSLPPMVVAAGLKALELIEEGSALRKQLFDNARYWREGLTSIGYSLLEGEHPIIPIMLGEARLAQELASTLFDEGVYVAGFFYPVVPQGKARIRTQMNAALNKTDLDYGLQAFERAGKRLGVI